MPTHKEWLESEDLYKLTPCPEAEIMAFGVMRAEVAAIKHAIDNVDINRFNYLAHVLADIRGRVFVTGVGKAAIVARKIAATLATVTVPATFLDPVGMYHGEMGGIKKGDIVIMVSQSGETEELNRLVEPLKKQKVELWALVGNQESTLGRLLCLATGVFAEPFAKVPTATSAALVAVGDAIATAVAIRKGLNEESLRKFHPGGIIGNAKGIASVDRPGQIGTGCMDGSLRKPPLSQYAPGMPKGPIVGNVTRI